MPSPRIVNSHLFPLLAPDACLLAAVHVGRVNLPQGRVAAGVAHCLHGLDGGGQVRVGGAGQQPDLAGGQALWQNSLGSFSRLLAMHRMVALHSSHSADQNGSSTAFDCHFAP